MPNLEHNGTVMHTLMIEYAQVSLLPPGRKNFCNKVCAKIIEASLN